MMWLKACPRCTNGDMYRDEDELRHCMQCGFIQGYTADVKTAQEELARFLSSGSAAKVEHREGIAA